jgi:hypothetical protein
MLQINFLELEEKNSYFIKVMGFLDIIHRLDFFKHISGTGICLHLQVKVTLLGPIDRASPYLWTKLHLKIDISSITWAQH